MAKDIEKHFQWLLEGSIRMPDGMLAAWVDHSDPSRPYEESTGYLITLLCYLYRLTGQDRFRIEASRTVRALVRALKDRDGCGREGTIYLFDTSVCLRALGTFLSTFPDSEALQDLERFRELAQRLARTACDMLRSRKAFLNPGFESGPKRWSETFNVHLIKAIHHVWTWMETCGQPMDLREIIDELMTERCREGLFFSDASHSEANLHAHCYALEGLLALEDRTREQVKKSLAEATERLAELQTPEGGLPRRWPITGESWSATDTTAQAVRIWQCTDPVKYGDIISKGLEFLHSMAHPDGGFLYSQGTSHVNSWSTIFAVQALMWRAVEADADWIV